MPQNQMMDGTGLLPEPVFDRLLANGRRRDRDHAPVVKIFAPVGAGTWLLNEAEPFDDGDFRLFGLCDPGLGEPEIGYVLRSELEELRMPAPFRGLGLERDIAFRHEHAHPLSVYADWASLNGRIDLAVDLERVFPHFWAAPGVTKGLSPKGAAAIGRFAARVDDLIAAPQRSAFRVREATERDGGVRLSYTGTGSAGTDAKIAALAAECERGRTSAED